MPLPLPPKSIIRCDAATAQVAHDQLTSVIAGHAQATTTYRFYEELDAWLGPWGQHGYPIAYGKFYNIAFSTNPKLNDNPNAQAWVWKTTILLQEALRDYVVGRIRDGTLPGLTEPQLRLAAFGSHPRAYDEGGLGMLILVEPALIPVIATIPHREFRPTSKNFGPTIEQVQRTLKRVAPQLAGNSLAALAGPAHTGILRRAVQHDRQGMLDEIAITRELGAMRILIERGEVDYIPALDQVIDRLNLRQFPDQGFARVGREVVEAARARRQLLLRNLNFLLLQSHAVRAGIEVAFPNLLRPR